MADRVHAKLSPSSAYRWLSCPASLVRAPETEDEASEYSLEGTAAHEFASYCLENNWSAIHALWPEHIDSKYDTPELRQHIQAYCEYVMRLKGAKGQLFVEQKLTVSTEFDVWGTGDGIVIAYDAGIIHVVDLKYGKGIFVDVEDNPQLVLYGIGSLPFEFLSGLPVCEIHVHIFQPRKNNIASQVYTLDELKAWLAENMWKIERAYVGTDIAIPGDHCKWCPIKATCPERAAEMIKLASFDFAEEPMQTYEPELLEDYRLVEIYVRIKQFRDWLDAVDEEVKKRAHDHPMQGLKWVKGKKVRKITDQLTAITALKAVGINAFKEFEIIGITEIEKQLKIKGFKVDDVLAGAYESIQGKPALVSADAKGEEVKPNGSASEDFSEVERF